jgi:hypothetical protein
VTTFTIELPPEADPFLADYFGALTPDETRQRVTEHLQATMLATLEAFAQQQIDNAGLAAAHVAREQARLVYAIPWTKAADPEVEEPPP